MTRAKTAGKILGVCVLIAIASWIIYKCVEIVFGITLW